jgi:hypothetical protein
MAAAHPDDHLARLEASRARIAKLSADEQAHYAGIDREKAQAQTLTAAGKRARDLAIAINGVCALGFDSGYGGGGCPEEEVDTTIKLAFDAIKAEYKAGYEAGYEAGRVAEGDLAANGACAPVDLAKAIGGYVFESSEYLPTHRWAFGHRGGPAEVDD